MPRKSKIQQRLDRALQILDHAMDSFERTVTNKNGLYPAQATAVMDLVKTLAYARQIEKSKVVIQPVKTTNNEPIDLEKLTTAELEALAGRSAKRANRT